MQNKWKWGAFALAMTTMLTSCNNATHTQDQSNHVASQADANKHDLGVVLPDCDLSDNAKLSRTLGHLLARQLKKSEEIYFDFQQVAQGILNEVSNRPSPMTESEYEAKMAQIQEVILEKKSRENLEAAEQFLSANATQEGVVQVIDNKVQYKILQEGTGVELQGKPEALLHYKGSFVNGQVFSSSLDNKEPILLPLSQTIPGFSLGMQGMKEGEKRVVFIHPDMAYGTSGQLPPNSLLIFEIELLEVREGSSIAASE